jgi:hypothetical protein
VLVLCRSVWVIEACQFFLIPSQSFSTALYPSKCYEPRSVLRLLVFSLFLVWDSHLSPSRSWECVMSWVLMDKLHELQSCNSSYVQCNSLQFNLQFSQNNSFSTIIQFHYNYTHDVMLRSLIVIHLLKSNLWHYEDFLT